ncbi:hypothetical protein [Rhizobium sp. BK176]|uniref:hypothetical protein n=1 Tax=Rhizobium sp. BK176 TaxID=2587071 RepID=UPI0021690DD5|nr:hypothetical protein [Rhizobium sp. BK176]MCS4088643.1 hypothetical protein [Rhizobium sp. BK176]
MVKLTTEVFDIDGRNVEITRIPPRMRTLTIGRDPEEKPEEQGLFELRIDGAFVARVKRPFGIGKQPFKLERLIDGYSVSGIGERDVYMKERLYTLESVAVKAVELRNDICRDVSSLPTTEELRVYLAKEAEQRRIENAERKTRDERDKQERAAERAAGDAALDDLIGGLKSIEERLGSELSNYEMNALRMAISKHEKDRETILTHRMAFESDEFRGK